MKKLGSIFSVMADVLGLIGFGLALFIMFRAFPNKDNLTFDYQAILVGIMAAIFTLIVGWNIFQMIDLKQKLEEVDKLKESFNEDICYAHNIIDLNKAETYAFLCQNCIMYLHSEAKLITKYQMLQYGLNSLKIFTKASETEQVISSITDSMIECLGFTHDTKLTEDEKDSMLMLLGSITHQEKIKRFDELLRLIKNA